MRTNVTRAVEKGRIRDCKARSPENERSTASTSYNPSCLLGFPLVPLAEAVRVPHCQCVARATMVDLAVMFVCGIYTKLM